MLSFYSTAAGGVFGQHILNLRLVKYIDVGIKQILQLVDLQVRVKADIGRDNLKASVAIVDDKSVNSLNVIKASEGLKRNT